MDRRQIVVKTISNIISTIFTTDIKLWGFFFFLKSDRFCTRVFSSTPEQSEKFDCRSVFVCRRVLYYLSSCPVQYFRHKHLLQLVQTNRDFYNLLEWVKHKRDEKLTFRLKNVRRNFEFFDVPRASSIRTVVFEQPLLTNYAFNSTFF